MSHYLYPKGEMLKMKRELLYINSSLFLKKGEKMSKIEDFGFYTIDIDYLEYLYSGDKEVYYKKI